MSALVRTAAITSLSTVSKSPATAALARVPAAADRVSITPAAPMKSLNRVSANAYTAAWMSGLVSSETTASPTRAPTIALAGPGMLLSTSAAIWVARACWTGSSPRMSVTRVVRLCRRRPRCSGR